VSPPRRDGGQHGPEAFLACRPPGADAPARGPVVPRRASLPSFTARCEARQRSLSYPSSAALQVGRTLRGRTRASVGGGEMGGARAANGHMRSRAYLNGQPENSAIRPGHFAPGKELLPPYPPGECWRERAFPKYGAVEWGNLGNRKESPMAEDALVRVGDKAARDLLAEDALRFVKEDKEAGLDESEAIGSEDAVNEKGKHE
jgi:hypothetical protein